MTAMQTLSDIIFSIKDKITDNEFKTIMDNLKLVNDNKNKITMKRCLVVVPTIKLDSSLTPIVRNSIMDKRIPFHIDDLDHVHSAIQEYGYICYDRFNNNIFLNDVANEDSNNFILVQTPIILKIIGDHPYIDENSSLPQVTLSDVNDITETTTDQI